jgi:hypothetical protein
VAENFGIEVGGEGFEYYYYSTTHQQQPKSKPGEAFEESKHLIADDRVNKAICMTLKKNKEEK